MAKTQRPTFISLDDIPEGELGYLPKLCDGPQEKLMKTTKGFLEYLAAGKVTIDGLAVHLRELEAVSVPSTEAAALAIAAYEHASALGLTDAQRGAWFYNLMLVGCDPSTVRQAVQSAHDLHNRGFANAPDALAQIVAQHFSTRYLPHVSH